jgi:predicted DNA-binding protein YlxM (UPF0122 family)
MQAPRIKGRLDDLRIGKSNDLRRKITDEQKALMHTQYHNGVSINQIARNIGCSKRSVQFELFPERALLVKQQAKDAKRWEPYNTKDIRREVMRKHRARKRELLKEGKLTIN